MALKPYGATLSFSPVLINNVQGKSREQVMQRSVQRI